MRQFLIASRLLHDPIEEPGEIHDVIIRPFRIPHDEEAIVRAYNSAFQEHWAHMDESPRGWCDRMESCHVEAELSWVAEPLDEPGRIVGFCICAALGEAIGPCSSAGCPYISCQEGWVDLLGTVPEWRGRGLGRALLLRCLHSMRKSGITYAVLGIDSGSRTSAAALYRSVGFIVPDLDAPQPVALHI